METHVDEAAQHPDATDRIRRQSDPAVNRRIDRDTDIRILWYTRRSALEIRERLAELDREPDVEGTLTTGGPMVALAGAALGGHAGKQLVAVLRRLGVRTVREIDRERQALRSLLRGLAGLAPAKSVAAG